MDDRDRLRRMRMLRGQLERLPASDERDRILREVAGRAADIETGDSEPAPRAEAAEPPAIAPPAPVRPRAARVAATPARRAGARGAAGRAHSRQVAAEAFADGVRPTPSLPEGLRLSLDDDAPMPGDRPWTRGLRG